MEERSTLVRFKVKTNRLMVVREVHKLTLQVHDRTQSFKGRGSDNDPERRIRYVQEVQVDGEVLKGHWDATKAF